MTGRDRQTARSEGLERELARATAEFEAELQDVRSNAEKRVAQMQVTAPRDRRPKPCRVALTASSSRSHSLSESLSQLLRVGGEGSRRPAPHGYAPQPDSDVASTWLGRDSEIRVPPPRLRLVAATPPAGPGARPRRGGGGHGGGRGRGDSEGEGGGRRGARAAAGPAGAEQYSS